VRERASCPIVSTVAIAASWTIYAAGAVLAATFAGFSCAAGAAHPVDPAETKTGTSVETAELEISASGVDRFSSCPPPGELGQDWIPPIPPWSPSSQPVEGADAGPLTPLSDEATTHGSTPTERAIVDTHDAFRSCYHHSLVYDPTQDGRVAIVLRVGPDGRVAQVESFGACELSSEAILCMRDSAKKLRFRPPAGGSGTITIPAVFTSSSAVRRTSPSSRDVYTAAAYLAIEELRPALHACEQDARRVGKSVVASGTFVLDLDAKGKVTHANIDPWSGDKDLLTCAAAALQTLGFAPPPGGSGALIARLAFNPRAGTK
jgi:hypothetical protein